MAVFPHFCQFFPIFHSYLVFLNFLHISLSLSLIVCNFSSFLTILCNFLSFFLAFPNFSLILYISPSVSPIVCNFPSFLTNLCNFHSFFLAFPNFSQFSLFLPQFPHFWQFFVIFPQLTNLISKKITFWTLRRQHAQNRKSLSWFTELCSIFTL